jgi:hypothetical protein
MKVTFNKIDLEKTAVRNTLVSIIGDSKHGGFMRIHGFKSKTGHGEIQDTTYCKGISYPNAVKASLAILDEIEANPDYSITVTRGVWENEQGEVSPTGRKSKAYEIAGKRTETYCATSPILREAFAKIRESLTNPEPPTKEYKSLANGVYVDEETGTLYVRDLRLVKKTVIIHGDYPHKAGSEVVAIADAIKRDMPVGNYRMFRMDAEFDAVTLGGMEIAPEPEAEGKIEQRKAEVTNKTLAPTN